MRSYLKSTSSVVLAATISACAPRISAPPASLPVDTSARHFELYVPERPPKIEGFYATPHGFAQMLAERRAVKDAYEKKLIDAEARAYIAHENQLIAEVDAATSYNRARFWMTIGPIVAAVVAAMAFGGGVWLGGSLPR